MACWFWNIDRGQTDYFSRELHSSRLRQGWGYSPELDLRSLKNKLDSGIPFDENEAMAWNRCHDMRGIENTLQEGDLVVVKNVPDGDHFTIVRVCGPYDFQLDPDIGDYGHLRAIDRPREFNRYAPAVPLPFTAALGKQRYPIRITYRHAETVRQLFGLPAEAPTASAEAQAERLERIRSELSGQLREQLRSRLQGAIDWRLAENLILNMLEADGMAVTYNGGPSERGADILAERDLGYGLSARIGIQVKFFEGVHSDPHGLDQLKQAFKEHGLDAALLVSFADELSPEVAARLTEMQRTLNIQAIYGIDLFGRLLDFVIGGKAPSP